MLPPQDPRSERPIPDVQFGSTPPPPSGSIPPPPSGAMPPPPSGRMPSPPRSPVDSAHRSWWQKKRYSIPLGFAVAVTAIGAAADSSPVEQTIATPTTLAFEEDEPAVQAPIPETTVTTSKPEPEPTDPPPPSTTTLPTTTTTEAPTTTTTVKELTDEEILAVIGPYVVREALIDGGISEDFVYSFGDEAIVSIADQACDVAAGTGSAESRFIELYAIVDANTYRYVTIEEGASVAGTILGVYCYEAFEVMQTNSLASSPPTTSVPAPTTLPPRPKVEIACPNDSNQPAPYRAEFDFRLIEEGEFKSMRITYGDGKSYTSASLEDAERNMFWHQYRADGKYRVSLAITDVHDRTSTAGCTFSWTEIEPPPTQSRPSCDPNYSGCVPIDSDVDCAGGSGNGPSYVRGPVRVIGRDIYGLDGNNDGIGCE